MIQLKTILVAVDFSEHSRVALSYAAEFAGAFDAAVLQEVEKLDPSIDTGFLTIDPADIDVAEDFDAINLLSIVSDADIVADAHARGLAFNVWTENNAGRMETLLGYGVDMIITDLCVLVMEPDRRRFTLTELAPGEAVESVRSRTSGAIDVAGKVATITV